MDNMFNRSQSRAKFDKNKIKIRLKRSSQDLGSGNAPSNSTQIMQYSKHFPAIIHELEYMLDFYKNEPKVDDYMNPDSKPSMNTKYLKFGLKNYIKSHQVK